MRRVDRYRDAAGRGERLPARAQPAAAPGHGDRSAARAGRLAEQHAGDSPRPAAIDDDAVGLTTAFAGIAETGTLMLLSAPETPTTLAFLPETSLVVLLGRRGSMRAYEDGLRLLREEHGRAAALDQLRHRAVALGRHRADAAARRARAAPPVRAAGRRAAGRARSRAVSRPRRPTAEELALWRRAMGGSAPLRERDVPPAAAGRTVRRRRLPRPERQARSEPGAPPSGRRSIRTARSASTGAPGCASSGGRSRSSRPSTCTGGPRSEAHRRARPASSPPPRRPAAAACWWSPARAWRAAARLRHMVPRWLNEERQPRAHRGVLPGPGAPWRRRRAVRPAAPPARALSAPAHIVLLASITSPNSTHFSPSNFASIMLSIGKKSSALVSIDHPGQQHRQLQVLNVGRLRHDVLARQVVAALLEDMDQGHRDIVAIDVELVGFVGFGVVLVHPRRPVAIVLGVLPLRIGRILLVERGDQAGRLVETRGRQHRAHRVRDVVEQVQRLPADVGGLADRLGGELGRGDVEEYVRARCS